MATLIETKNALAINGGTPGVANPPLEKWVKINDDAKAAVMKLLDAGVASIVGNGGVIGEFEAEFAAMVGTRYCLTMTNGTAALHSAYFAVGVGPGDEVIVPTYTWHATITPILHCAATPVFCDIDERTLTIDPDDIERKITPRTKAVCVVHAFGNVCDMDRILEITQRHDIALIEDCSHAHGATWNGKAVGSLGDVGCFSMQGGKAVSGGESGAVTTNSALLMDRMILLGHFGRTKEGADAGINRVGDMNLGVKYRVHPLAVALASVDLKRLAELNQRRTANYELLNDALRNCPGIEVIDALPSAQRGGYLEFKFILSQELLEKTDRKSLVAAMAAEGVPISADRYSDFNYTYGLLHTAPLFREFDLHSVGGCFYDPTQTKEQEQRRRQIPVLPVAERLAKQLITLPAFVDVEPESLTEVAAAMRKVLCQVDSVPEAA